MSAVPTPVSVARATWRELPARGAVAVMLACLVAGLLAMLLRPVPVQAGTAPDLATAVPLQIGAWKEQPSLYVSADLSVTDADERSNNRPYDQTVTRTYVDPQGRHVMLAIAYALEQEQEVKVHRPDVCYPAQGFQILRLEPVRLPLARPDGTPVDGVQMLVRSRQRLEAVVYWLRTGSVYSQRSWDARLHIFEEGLKGRRPDGILVRASRVIDDPAIADATYAELSTFLAALYGATAPSAARTLIR